MSEAEKERFKIVFRGELVARMDEAGVRANLKERFKFSDDALERLFSGRPVVMKGDLDRESAERFSKALWQAGARCVIESMVPAPLIELGRTAAAPAPAAAQMVCPNCRQKQPQAAICVGCGVVVAKFLSRQEESGALPAAASPSGGVSLRVTAALKQTRPWVRLVSVLMFLGGALGLLGSLLTLMATPAVGAPGRGGAILLGQFLMCVFYFFPAWFLYQYGSAIAVFLGGGEVAGLEVALERQKSFWKFVGISALIGLVLGGLGILAAIAVPLFFGGR
jgi:hypothetical protein